MLTQQLSLCFLLRFVMWGWQHRCGLHKFSQVDSLTICMHFLRQSVFSPGSKGRGAETLDSQKPIQKRFWECWNCLVLFEWSCLFSRCCLQKLRLFAVLNLSELFGFCCIKLCQTVTLYTDLQLRFKMKFYAYPIHNSLGCRLNQHSFCICCLNTDLAWHKAEDECRSLL